MKTQVRFSALGAAKCCKCIIHKTVLDAKTVSIIMRVLLGKKKDSSKIRKEPLSEAEPQSVEKQGESVRTKQRRSVSDPEVEAVRAARRAARAERRKNQNRQCHSSSQYLAELFLSSIT